MNSQYLQNPPLSFRTKTSYFYVLVTALIALAVGVSLVRSQGLLSLVTHAWPLYFLVYAVWYLLMRPHLTVDWGELTVVNPFVTHRVGYGALIDVSTKFNLTLITVQRKYQAFAIPSTGMVASLNRHRGDLKNHPAIPGIGTGSIRASDLPHGFSGGVALVVRGYWQELVEAEKLDTVSARESSELDIPGCLVFALLALATILTFWFVY